MRRIIKIEEFRAYHGDTVRKLLSITYVIVQKGKAGEPIEVQVLFGENETESNEVLAERYLNERIPSPAAAVWAAHARYGKVKV